MPLPSTSEKTLHQTRPMTEGVQVLDARVRAAAKQNAIARLFMTAPGVGALIALSVASTYDDASRFRRSSSAGAYLGLTPRRYESGEVSRNGRVSKRGDKLTRTHLYEAATRGQAVAQARGEAGPGLPESPATQSPPSAAATSAACLARG
jgi:transposase